jgi:hypothetical protein
MHTARISLTLDRIVEEAQQWPDDVIAELGWRGIYSLRSSASIATCLGATGVKIILLGASYSFTLLLLSVLLVVGTIAWLVVV